MALQRKRISSISSSSGNVRNGRSSRKTKMSYFTKTFQLPPYFTITLFIWGIVASLVSLLLLVRSPQKEYAPQTINGNSSYYHLNEGCTIGCATTFGTILGIHNGVFAYSNCNSTTCISGDWYDLGSVYTSMTFKGNNSIGNGSGLKWQCVEYARRYWMLRGSPLPATFAAVEGAADIWALQSVQLEGGTKTPLLKYPNGVSLSAGGSAPLVGDLLIYPRQKGGFMYGHVAVIVGVTDTDVLVAEQNWDNTAWPGPYHNYSRAIPMLYDAKKQSYTLNEPDGIIIQGWIRYRM
ncbi:CHAP domain [Trypanosoma melophagium]|uniref:CHAP domain n=1 Tax=Trypanosoma melophagium TaxID=715481 RepID=UPI00351A1293|nr:CHAP domain [Trypanosoma melophagium]